MIKQANWIEYKCTEDYGCPEYKKTFTLSGNIKKAILYITARGVYEAKLNGKRIGGFVLAPGWTVYEKRHQYQEYDVTSDLKAENDLSVTVAPGWYQWENVPGRDERIAGRRAGAVIASLVITCENGETQIVHTDETWLAGESKLLYSHLYNGEIFDATKEISYGSVEVTNYSKDALIPQEGEIICEHERVKPLSYIITPKGERVIDFGQNMTGYVEFEVTAKAGERVKISHAEILDSDGNFYTKNYRSAKANIEYICRDGTQIYKPTHNFYGFRYIRLDEYPDDVNCDDFTAIVVHSNIKRTGFLHSGSELLNKFFSNVFWGQKSNFLDIPTDCPQRDERLGWTADTHVFIKAASYNYNTDKFFQKWLGDMVAEQLENGFVPVTIPSAFAFSKDGAAWSDAVTICPWQLYLAYGDKEMLRRQLPSMKKWISFIQSSSKDKYLWTGGNQFGDWLALDAPEGSRIGASNTDFIASAFYAHSVSRVIESLRALGEDFSYYEDLHKNIVDAFRTRFPVYQTQTEHVLAIEFNLAEDITKTSDALAQLVHKNGNSLTTGFVGTPYLLHALSKGGHTNLAYTLLLREEYPSWLFSVKMGATTIWEHWDGMREDGSVWSSTMNSFNHYAYGAVIDWVYEVSAGIQTVKEYPGFEKVIISPHPDKRLGHLDVKIDTKNGPLRSFWQYNSDGSIRYEITVPCDAEITIGTKNYSCSKGDYIFYSQI
ncbi:MAG: alfa-L-rhamnosidase [Ruminococcaceae bacterium]|nr:alfa-L-rhamnosidase [Oscillospiraceae bacterium]